MTLVDAVQQRHLVYWHDRGFVRTVEPYLLAMLQGQRLALIARQVDGGPAGEPDRCWKVIDISDGLNVNHEASFSPICPVPQHLLSLVRFTYCSA